MDRRVPLAKSSLVSALADR